MKKIISVLFSILCLITGLTAQNVDDALRYSQLFYSGTARFMSMGGAFTALGGDMSTLSQNPAGLGVFRSSEISITPQLYQIRSTAGFRGTSTEENLYNFNLTQGGIVTSLVSNDNTSGLVSLNFGYSFNKTNNLNQNIIIQGTGNSSMADYWTGIADGYHKSELGANVPDAALAFDAWIIDTLPGANTHYGTVYSNYGDNPPSVYGQSIRRLVNYEGYTGEHAISFGGNYSNKFFFGATFGINSLRYISHYEHLESTNLSLPSEFKDFNYTDHYENNGTGYTFKLGAIIKPVETLRIGLAFHAPVWYHIREYFYEDISSKFTDGSKYEYYNEPLRYEYALATPFRFLAGLALQVQKVALLSVDYEFVDYSAAKFSQTGDGYNYTDKNNSIRNTLNSTSNFRAGAEFRFNNLYLRTGYGYYGRPFKSGEDNADLDYRSISGGIGFREKNLSIDFGYTNLKSSQMYVMYPTPNNLNPAIADLNTGRNMYTLTLGYKLRY